MFNAKNTSILILSILWVIGGIRLLWTGSFSLLTTASSMSGFFVVLGLVLAVAIGGGKGFFLLQKTAQRSIDASAQLSEHLTDYAFGWLKVLGIRGIVVISLMVGLGLFFGSEFSPVTPFVRGLIRIAIGLALIVGSFKYWYTLKQLYEKV